MTSRAAGRLTAGEGYARRVPEWRWRDFLTAEERDQVQGLEDRAADLDGERRRVSAMLGPIRNRALQRAKFAAGLSALAAGDET